MNKIVSYLKDVKTVGIAGHVNPDGDCVGSTLGLYLYLKQYHPQIQADLYLEFVRPEFEFLQSIDERKEVCDSDKVYDLFITVDVSTKERIGVALEAFAKAKRTLCVDHHVSNQGFADDNVIVPDASSASEVIYDLLDETITKAIAEPLYLGIVHDTGVFQYSSTSLHTMQIAGMLMNTGIDFTKIIEETYFQKTFAQQKILGRALDNSVLYLNGKCIVSILSSEEMEECKVSKKDLDGIVSQLRLTKDAEVALFLYQTDDKEYKASLRSKSYADVNAVANQFGGGGHVRAAGLVIKGEIKDILNQLLSAIEKAI